MTSPLTPFGFFLTHYSSPTGAWWWGKGRFCWRILRGGSHGFRGNEGGKNIERELLTANSDPRQGIEENCNTTQTKRFSDFLLPTPRR